jgi:hypothetical protein
LQSLDDLESSLQSLVLDDQPQQQQPQQQQQPRRSKRIQEQNAKKQSLLPSSPVSTIDTPFSTSTSTTSSQQSLDLVPEIMASSSIITPMKKTTTPGNKPLGVRFGTNSVAKFSGCDPATVIQRLSLDASQQLFPHEGRNDNEDDEEPSLDNYDDETKLNCHILAQWDDSFDELNQSSDESDDDDDESIEADNSLDEGDDDVEEELPTQWRDAKLVVEEEEEIFDTTNNMLTSPHVSHRPNALSRLTKRVDEYFCKSCGLIGMRRTTRYVYGEEN